MPSYFWDYPYHEEVLPVTHMGITDPIELIKPDLVAPTNVLSTNSAGGYSNHGQTSGAAPHVAGVAALMLDVDPSLTPADISRILQTKADPLGASGKDNVFGAGLLNAYEAYSRVVFEMSTRIVEGPELEAKSGLFETETLALENYPNPFNSATTIAYSLSGKSHVSLRVYNMLGQEVGILLDEEQNAGLHYIRYDAEELAAGVYFYRLVTSGQALQGQMLRVE